MATSTTNFSFSMPTVGADADSWGTLLNGNWSSLDSILNGDGASIVIDGYTVDGLTLTGVVSLEIAGPVTETTYGLASSGAVTVSPANGTIQTIAMTGDITLSDSLSNGQFVTLKITSVGSNTITWPTMDWVFGEEPDLDATNTNWVQLWKVGGTLYGSFIGFSF